MKFADAPPGHLPLGFVALDLAHALNMPLIDPDDGYKTDRATASTPSSATASSAATQTSRKWWWRPMAARI